MLNIKLKNLFWTTAALFCATQFCSAQASDSGPSAEVPQPRPAAALPNPNGDLTMAGEYKQPKEVVEQEKPVCDFHVYFEGGYQSEYIFRGTNLMPDSDGGGFLRAELSKWGFTLGAWGIDQFGTARAPGWAMGESGGGGMKLFQPGQFLFLSALPETTQSQFNEFDLFLEYHREFGWFDVTVGNIAFFIQRNAQTSADITINGYPNQVFHYRPVGRNTVQDERFDRIYVSLSTSKIPYVTPKITYYQTIYSEGSEPFKKKFFDPDSPFPNVYHNVPERNDELGGYLEGKLNGHFHISDRIDVNPYGLVSYSFHDRTEPIENLPEFDPARRGHILKDSIRGRSLVGFNDAEIGIDIPILLLRWTGVSKVACAPPEGRLRLVPFGRYTYHISDPNPGTDRNEWWGGAKLTLTF